MKRPKREIKSVFYMTVQSGIGKRDTVGLDQMIDMLRYDCAFINEKYPNVVAFPTFKIQGSGTYKGTTTTERWRSFLLYLSPYQHPDIEPMAMFVQDPNGWVTYRTIDHVKTTLQEFMDGVGQ